MAPFAWNVLHSVWTFTNISQARTAAEDLIKEGVLGPELEKQMRYRAARQVNVKDIVLEVLPHPENRVVLSSQKDALGIPEPEVHYSMDDYVHRGMVAAKFTMPGRLLN